MSPGGGPADDVEGADLTGVSPDVDMRCYNELMNSVPQECSSVPLIMHCMLEQVSGPLFGYSVLCGTYKLKYCATAVCP